MILSYLVKAHERLSQASEPDGSDSYPYRVVFNEGARSALQDVLNRVETLLNPDVADRLIIDGSSEEDD